jgi:hypothetical protein
VSVFDVATYVYPWDVVGDPAAPELLAGLGIDHVTLAAFYHGTRALTPRHPGHRVVVAEHTASYLPAESESPLIPSPQTWIASEDAFGESTAALAAVGVPVHAWVVVNHVDSLDGPHVVNAYGDRYPWALCPSQDVVRDYAVALATEVATRPDVSGVEFEAAGWYGFDHLHQHDKVSSVPLDDAEQFLFSLCFCDACEREYQFSDIDPARLRATVRERLDRTFGGLPAGAEVDGSVVAMRTRVADRLREAMVREVRKHRPEPDFPIAFHGNPRPHRSTAFTGLDPSTLPAGTTGVVVNCWDGDAENVTLTKRPGVKVLAGLLGIRGMGSRPDRHPEIVDAMISAGADGIRVYHAGLASTADLDAIRALTAYARTAFVRSAHARTASERHP